MVDAAGIVQEAALVCFLYDWTIHLNTDLSSVKANWRDRRFLTTALYFLTRALAVALLVGNSVSHHWEWRCNTTSDPHPASIIGSIILCAAVHLIFVARFHQHQHSRFSPLMRIVLALYVFSLVASVALAGTSVAVWTRQEVQAGVHCDAGIARVPPTYCFMLIPWLLFGIGYILLLARSGHRRLDNLPLSSGPPAAYASECKDLTSAILVAGVTLFSKVLYWAHAPIALSNIAIVHAALPMIVSRVFWRMHGLGSSDADEGASSSHNRHASLRAPVHFHPQRSESHDFDTGSITLKHKASEDGSTDIKVVPAEVSYTVKRVSRVDEEPADRPITPQVSLTRTPTGIAHTLRDAELAFDTEFDDDRKDGVELGIVSGAAMKAMSSDDVTKLVLPGAHGRIGRTNSTGSSLFDDSLAWSPSDTIASRDGHLVVGERRQ